MIYLDNAATTFPKPRCVAEEITKCIKEYCGNPGRSGHILSMKAAEKIYECRETVADFFGSDEPENVVFTLNTTYALNIAIKTLYEKDSHVLISNMEHNSVFRPIWHLAKNGKISFDTFNLLQPTHSLLQELKKKKQKNTKMLIMLHASNICGKVFPIKEIGDFCDKNDITFVVDAAQSAGNININMKECHIDALCVPAHKGLYGPQGLGFVIYGCKPSRIFLAGGNGINSLSPEMGLDLPESFESGTVPTPLIAALNSSLKWLKSIGVDNIRAHEVKLAESLSERLHSIKGSILFGDAHPQNGIVLYKNKYVSTDKLSAALTSKHICIRSGFHCAPLAHNTLGTGEDGAIRISAGFFNTAKDISCIYAAIKEYFN